MNRRTYCGISATLFAVVTLAHLMRLVNGWSFETETVAVPMWALVIGLLGPGALAVWGFREANKPRG
ncbi:MAG: hypothetical protein ACR2Q3_15315 [Woeseiaceae bacterium]